MGHGSFEDAVRVLRDRMSGRWDGLEADGRDEMVETLRRELDYSKGQAREVIDEMIEAGLLRYHHPGRDDNAAEVNAPVAIPANTLGVGEATPSTTGGAAAAPFAAPLGGPGFWQIGHTQDAEGETQKPAFEGRAGQIDPTA
jgi:hypothetical protein